MKRQPWHYAMLGALLAVGVLYGIELSSDGIEDSYGPIGRTAAERQADRYVYGPNEADPYGRQPAAYGPGAEDPYAGRTYPESRAAERQPYGGAAEPLPYGSPEQPAGPTAGAYAPSPYDMPPGGGAVSSRLADGTAGLLQSAADEGIKLVVSFFEAITK